MRHTVLILMLLCGGIANNVQGQNRPIGNRPEPAIEYRTRDRLSVEAGWPGTNRVVQAGHVQLAKNNSSERPPAPPVDDDLLPTGPVFISNGPGRSIREYSRIHIDPLPRKEVKLHDIVTIIVDEKSEVIMNQKFSRQKNAGLKADLKSFVRLGETGNLVNAAGNNPKIDGQMSSNLNASGLVTDQEGIKYRIAARVVGVMPNGTIQLEAKKTIQTQDDVSEYELTGDVRSMDINPDNTASSENIADLKIVKKQQGRVYSSTKRNWGVRILDFISPF